MVMQSQGVHGEGSRDYSAADYRRVVSFIRNLASERATVEDIATLTGISGRTIREIVSNADGVEFLLGGDGNGYRLATCTDDADRLTARYLSQARRMQERVDRRQRYVESIAG